MLKKKLAAKELSTLSLEHLREPGMEIWALVYLYLLSQLFLHGFQHRRQNRFRQAFPCLWGFLKYPSILQRMEMEITGKRSRRRI